VATAAYHLPANVYHAIMAAASVASSTASAAAHATLETKEKVQERIAQNAAVSESVSPHERMERAKSALEHHEAALAHATAKEQRKKEAGLDYVEEKVSESFQSAKVPPRIAAACCSRFVALKSVQEHAGSVAANVTGALRGTFQAVEQKTHELQESYYKGQAVSENRSPAERMEAAKKALGHHQAASKTS
jgi:3-polyprenyl-4-hydroxybenzoate decarboxylase